MHYRTPLINIIFLLGLTFGACVIFNRHSNYSDSDEDIPSMNLPQAEVSEGLSTTTFEITNQATIPSDNASHKVITYLIMGLNYLP